MEVGANDGYRQSNTYYLERFKDWSEVVVLEEAGVADIDLPSLDVEGREADVPRGLDLDRYAPRFVLVETNDVSPRSEAVLKPGGLHRPVGRSILGRWGLAGPRGEWSRGSSW